MNGGESEFEEFYRDHYLGLLKSLIIAAAGDVELAKDAMDEAMTVAYEKWDSILNPPAYVRRVAVHRLIKEKVKARRAIPTPPDETAEKPNHTTGQVIWEQQTWVVWLLEQLSPAQREALACIVDDLKPAEIAELLGKTPEAVRQNLSAARRRLTKYLAETNGAEMTATAHGEEAR
ncbi:MAG TPA: sigma-70 family RNA polymerase sigma factor [Streptosporangiaceae bacterium]|jgi:RNA polymerase sigma-70 factor (ECF subfamily)|nr:sigma-70 family RNA polymerase sigma factor [Streptosporangiaceae bacterium]